LALTARANGFPLNRHTVFFSDDTAREFNDIGDGRAPSDPTVYVCAQDRGAGDGAEAPEGPERLLCVVNAPANGDTLDYDETEKDLWEEKTFRRLARCGLTLERSAPALRTAPSDFERLFPATGGALYGRASHGWMASFLRPGARSPMPGLYFAGGSVHPGPGAPMAAISGRLAAERVITDLGST
jgi:1-hydroxycarotenoid 3,4-desaturase